MRLVFSCFVFTLTLSLPVAAHQLHFIPAKATSPEYKIDVHGVAHSETGNITIDMVFENRSTSDVLLDLSSIELVTQEGGRSPLLISDANGENNVLRQTKKHFLLNFQPINSVTLYKLLNIMGDFEPQYTLNLATLSKNTHPVHISLVFPDKDYKNYLTTVGKEQNLYLHLPLIDAEHFVSAQTTYMNNQFKEEYPETISIVALAEQIVINGLVFQWRAYEREEKLELSLHVLNHGSHDLTLDINQLAITLANKHYLPSNNFSSLPAYLQADVVPNTNSKQYRIKRGNRFNGVFIYDISPGEESFQLNMDGIRVADKPFFAQPFMFSALNDITH